MGGSSTNPMQGQNAFNSGGTTNPYTYEQMPTFQQSDFQNPGAFEANYENALRNDLYYRAWNAMHPQQADWGSEFAQLMPPQQQTPNSANTQLIAQQGTFQGLPGLTGTAQPNLTAGSTFAMPQLSGNQGTVGPQSPFSNAVANILSGNK